MVGKPSSGYSHAGWGFLHDYDPPVPSRTLAERLTGKDVCVCTGPGGVGKTTTAAAIALGLAQRGQRVAVVTIDPARRLAGALGVQGLTNEPRRVDPELLAAQGVEPPGRAVGHDARCEGHLRCADRPARP